MVLDRPGPGFGVADGGPAGLFLVDEALQRLSEGWAFGGHQRRCKPGLLLLLPVGNGIAASAHRPVEFFDLVPDFREGQATPRSRGPGVQQADPILPTLAGLALVAEQPVRIPPSLALPNLEIQPEAIRQTAANGAGFDLRHCKRRYPLCHAMPLGSRGPPLYPP